MNINRNNFEEFCLLYLDGELSQAERQELESFVAANPDLAMELDLLQQLKLKPETDAPVSFDKSSLFRSSALENEAIHTGNFETYFLLYTDDELDEEGRKSVEKFVMNHPEYQKEFNLLQASRLVAEPISFPDKSLLYRKATQPARITVMRYWRVAAAAAVIVGGIWIGLNTQKNSSGQTPVAGFQAAKDNKKESASANSKPEPAKNETNPENSNAATPGNAVITESVKQEPATALATNKNRVQKQDMKPAQKETNEVKVTAEEPQLAINEPRKSNDLPVPNVNTTTEQPSMNTESNSNSITKVNPNVDVVDRALGGPNVKNDFASEALLNASETNTNTTNYEQEDDHKSPLRGVFRKASRMINRVTNPDIFKPSSKQNK